jgi:lipopolysaccharide export system protein LptA
VPNRGKNPDHQFQLRPAARWSRKVIVALVATLCALALAPAAGSWAAQESSTSAAQVHRRAANKSGKSGSSATKSKAAAAGETSDSSDMGPGLAGLTGGKGPINIQSDTLSLDYKKKTVLFAGHVRGVQSGTQLTSDALHVNYEQNFKDVKDMTADGNVKITQGGRWATSDHAVLNQANHTVVMTGNPVVHDGNDEVTGSKITVYLNTGRSVVEQAHAMIFPRQSQTTDNGAAGAASTDGSKEVAATADKPSGVSSPGAGTSAEASGGH